MTIYFGREPKGNTEAKLKQRLLDFGCDNSQVDNYLEEFRIKQFKARSKDLHYNNLILHLEFKLKMIDPVLEPETYKQAKAEKIKTMKDLNNFRLKNYIYLVGNSNWNVS